MDVYQSLDFLTIQTKTFTKEAQQKQKDLSSIVIPEQVHMTLQKAQDKYESRCRDLQQIGIDTDIPPAQIRQNIRMREKAIQSHKETLIDVEERLIDIQKCHINQRHYEQLFQEVEKTHHNIQKDFDNCQHVVQQLEQEISLLDSKIYTTKLEMKNTVLRQELIHLKEQKNSDEIHCPVCGSTEHPYLDEEKSSDVKGRNGIEEKNYNNKSKKFRIGEEKKEAKANVPFNYNKKSCTKKAVYKEANQRLMISN